MASNAENITVGLLASVGGTIDAFFGPIIDRWQERGVKVVTAAGTPVSRPANDHYVIPTLTRTPEIRNVFAPRALRRWAKTAHLDVVLTNTATASTFVRLAALRQPVVYFCHGLHWDQPTVSTIPFRVAENALLRRTTAAVTINSNDFKWIRKRRPSLPQLNLLHGVGLDLERFARRPRIPYGGRASLLWVGEFSERKDPLAAIEVAKHLAQIGVIAELTMLGEGPLQKQAQEAAMVSGVDVRFPGRQDPVAYLRGAHVMVHTAKWEGLPRVLLEAAAVGIPTVAFDVKGVRDVPGVRLANPGDSNGLAELARLALSDPPPQLDPQLLRHAHAADALHDFLVSVHYRKLESGEVWTR